MKTTSSSYYAISSRTRSRTMRRFGLRIADLWRAHRARRLRRQALQDLAALSERQLVDLGFCPGAVRAASVARVPDSVLAARRSC